MDENPYQPPVLESDGEAFGAASSWWRSACVIPALFTGLGCFLTGTTALLVPVNLLGVPPSAYSISLMVYSCVGMLWYAFLCVCFALATKDWIARQLKLALVFTSMSVAGAMFSRLVITMVRIVTNELEAYSIIPLVLICCILYFRRAQVLRIVGLRDNDNHPAELKQDSSAQDDALWVDPIAFCSNCEKEVAIDEDERCLECRWPI